jgi:hypothetical protein
MLSSENSVTHMREDRFYQRFSPLCPRTSGIQKSVARMFGRRADAASVW